jgi:nitrogen fixation/metabolism regulation signal transduction histidine kinase
MIMLFMSFILITTLMIIYSQSEERLSREIERQTRELTKAIQIGVEETTATGDTDEARLSKYLKELNSKGLKEISIISNLNEIVASTNPAKIGQPMTHKKKELIIKAELGEPVSEEGSAYNVIIPVIAGNTQYGYVHLKINKDDFNDILRENTVKRITATILVFGIGVILAFVLSRHYTNPIKQIVDASMRVAAGDLNQHIPVKSKDEIGQLSESFNFMVDKLRENRELEERLREAEHLSGLGQLSRDMAHEIRNPLNFINLSVEYIDSKYRPGDRAASEKFDSLISGIKLEIQRLNTLVNDFLDYSRPIKLRKQPVELGGLIEDVMALIWAKAAADDIKIVLETEATAVFNADPDLFKSCILNIITNAFHAMTDSDRERILTIRTDKTEDTFVLAVKDTGAGVSEENLSRIFEPFFSTKQNGLGIGLPMARRVIEEHGGRIEFDSIADMGSEVKLILPIKET